MSLASRTWAALVHHPIYDRARRVVTSAITNLDIHDLARSSCTYGLAGYHLVTPIAAQRALAERILRHWRDPLDPRLAHHLRRQALTRVAVVASVEESLATVEQNDGQTAVVVATAARDWPGARSHAGLRVELGAGDRPLLLLFGTGWGLADRVLDRVDHVLLPIRGNTDYNHLSVRSAAAIILDRLFGDRMDEGLDQGVVRS